MEQLTANYRERGFSLKMHHYNHFVCYIKLCAGLYTVCTCCEHGYNCIYRPVCRVIYCIYRVVCRLTVYTCCVHGYILYISCCVHGYILYVHVA